MREVTFTLQMMAEGESGCPFLDPSVVCNASLTLLMPAERARADYCRSENYDSCPLFLAKLLRRR